MKYSYLLFDLDGTLTDSKPGIVKSVQYALKKEGYGDYAPEALNCFVGPPLHKQFASFCHVDEAEGIRMMGVYRERFGTVGLFENSVYEGIPSLLNDLKAQGRHLAVATSKPTFYTTKILDKFELSPYFEVVVGAEMDGRRSAKAEIIEEVLRKFGLRETDKSSCLMIGDRAHDIAGAQACGIDSLGARYGYSEGTELADAGATYIVESVAKMAAFFAADCPHNKK